ncbi:MAG: VanZ family protein [Burkholderiales bacterium PBB4]|nr:MAG: VanZ family protein [Burkholderiales bacterium PBB4]
MHKTTAWPLALLYSGLIVYASLYPFADWRDQDIAPWTFVFSPLSPYWTGFDVGVNIVGYVPLGALLALAGLRSGRSRRAVLWASVCGVVLSLGMEMLQSYLPARVPSKVDWALNSAGAVAGAMAALALERLGALDRWSRLRERWFVPQARGGLVLMATWPAALLFPAAVPFGLGQVLERILDTLAAELADTPFAVWLPASTSLHQGLSPGSELVCVFLGILIPCLLAFCIARGSARRAMLAVMTVAVGVATTALSSAMSWGPQHAWAWLSLPAQWGVVAGALVAVGLAWAPWRLSGALLLLALGLYLSLLNQAPESPYFAQTLQAWEQGRFIRFHGLAQWLGWLWPYAALAYVMTQVGRRGANT